MVPIQFPEGAPTLTQCETLAFPVVIFGARTVGEITAEALEDHFGVTSCSQEDLAIAFDSNRLAIQKVARDRLAARWAGGRAILLSEDF